MATMQVGQTAREPKEVLEKAKRARGWFLAIVIFSVINTVLVLAHANVSFVIGLGTTQVVDAIFSMMREKAGGGLSGALLLLGLLINLIPLGVYLLIWYLSGTGNATAYAVGMVLYLLDGLLFLLVKDFIGIAFHAYFLFQLWAGYPFVKGMRAAQAALAAPAEMPAPMGEAV